MKITVRLLASYRRFLPEADAVDASYPLQLPTPVPVEVVLAKLPIPAAEQYTFFVNGRHAGREQLLKDGDVLTVFPAAGGG